MGSRYINSQSQVQSQSHSQNQSQSQSQRSMWYIDANNLYGYALMQKLPYKDSGITNTTLNEVLNTPDDSDYG